MKFINLLINCPKTEVASALRNYERINEGVKFDEKGGKPAIRFKEKGSFAIITCKMVGGPSLDNGFIVGTFFLGKIKEKDGKTSIRGLITTAPLYHLGLLALTVFFVYKCIELGGFNPVPVILLLFSFFLFKGEFKKQGIIARFLERAKRKIENGEIK